MGRGQGRDNAIGRGPLQLRRHAGPAPDFLGPKEFEKELGEVGSGLRARRARVQPVEADAANQRRLNAAMADFSERGHSSNEKLSAADAKTRPGSPDGSIFGAMTRCSDHRVTKQRSRHEARRVAKAGALLALSAAFGAFCVAGAGWTTGGGLFICLLFVFVFA